MLIIMPETGADLLAIRAAGKLTHSDYTDILVPRLEAIIEKYGKARVLCDMGKDFEGWEMEAMWDDAKLGLTHRNDFSKFAVVGGPDWLQWASRLAGRLMDTEVETFPHTDLERAFDWINA